MSERPDMAPPDAPAAPADYGEPWRVQVDEHGAFVVHTPHFFDKYLVIEAVDEQTAARIAATINACAGVPTEALPAAPGVLAALLEALEARREAKRHLATFAEFPASVVSADKQTALNGIYTAESVYRAALDRALALLQEGSDR